MDVKTAFLNDLLKEEVYVSQLDGFIYPGYLEKVYRLRKALYRLKQPPRAWYDELLTFMISKSFTKEILKKHGMDKYDSIGTPMATKPKLGANLSGTPVDQTRYQSMIGSLMYLTSSRPNLVQAVCYYARYQYLKDSGFKQTTFSDANDIGCLDTRKSTSGGIQFLAIAISCNPVQHSRTKHINDRYHFIKEHVERGIVELYFVRTEYQLADMFTKALLQERFEYLVGRLGMRCLTPAEPEVLANESA
ncbi:copia-type pol polyprotein [Tanacetum coccineum]